MLQRHSLSVLNDNDDRERYVIQNQGIIEADRFLDDIISGG